MKPIAVFQHTEVGAPGAVIPILEELGASVQLVRIVAGEPVPKEASAFSGLVFMGGYMGVHDDYPWIAEELALIRQADALGIPVAGHCLGSQLTALALGGEVHKHTRPEVGWNPIATTQSDTARDWLGDYADQNLETFQWHGDTFTPPAGAAQLARSEYCANQMFVVHGKHLLVQSHLEMTPGLVELSLERNGAMLKREYAAGNPAVSSPESTLEDLPARTARMHGILRRLYQRWLAGRA